MIHFKHHVYRNVAWASAHHNVHGLVGQSGPISFQREADIPWASLQSFAHQELNRMIERVMKEQRHAERVSKLKPVGCCKDEGCLCPDCRSKRRGG